jgi:hypothetical protein
METNMAKLVSRLREAGIGNLWPGATVEQLNAAQQMLLQDAAGAIERLVGVLDHLWTMGIPAETVPMVRAILKPDGDK